MKAFLCNSSEHVVSLTHSVAPFDILLLLLQAHGSIQLFSISLRCEAFLDLLILLLTLVGFCLSLDNSTPLIEVTTRVCWIVSHASLLQRLKLLSFVFKGLLNSLCVHLQWIDQVLTHYASVSQISRTIFI